jgi:YD repeat-containing protein
VGANTCAFRPGRRALLANLFLAMLNLFMKLTRFASRGHTRGDGEWMAHYDAEGNLTSKTRLSDGETWTNTWDYRNRLMQVVEKTSGGAKAAENARLQVLFDLTGGIPPGNIRSFVPLVP